MYQCYPAEEWPQFLVSLEQLPAFWVRYWIATNKWAPWSRQTLFGVAEQWLMLRTMHAIPRRNMPVHTGQNKHEEDKWNVLCKQWRIPDFERQGRTWGSRLRIQRWIHWREQGAKPWETKDRSEPPEAEQFWQRGTQLCTYSKFHGQSAIKSPDKISESSYTSPESATVVTCQRPAGPVTRLLKK